MDWYFGSDVADLVVPRDEEPLDRLPSPNSWSQWGVSKSESFDSSSKCFVTETSSTGGELNFNGKNVYEEADMDICAHEVEHSSNSNVCTEFQKGSLEQVTGSYEGMDYQLNNLARTNHVDDIFLSSLLEEDPAGMDNLHGSVNFFPEFEHGAFPACNLLSDEIMDSDCDQGHLVGMASSKYLKAHAFSPAVGWERGEVASLSTHSNSRQKDNPPVKAQLAGVLVSSEFDIMNRQVDDEASMEVSVLQELESVMAQMSRKTRICFRDALFRLAMNSKHQAMNHCQNDNLFLEKPPPLIHDKTSRLANNKATESETNAIDRAVANLMFFNADPNAQDRPADLLAAPITNLKEETKGSKGLSYRSLSQPEPPHWPRWMHLAGDAEVPIVT